MMSSQSPPVLVFGTKFGPETGPEGTLESNQVPVQTIQANLKTLMESVKILVHETQRAVGDLAVSHVDVGIAISIDGSVGLVGTGVNANTEATLKVRLRFGRSLRF